MAKLPSFQFYPGDWMKDPSLRRCTHAAKGVYMDMLCLMFECEERGMLATAGTPWTDDDIARAVGGDLSQTAACIRELVEKGVVSRSETGAIYCRRMVRDEHKRKLCVEAGKRGGNPTLKGSSKGQSTAKCNGEHHAATGSEESGVFDGENEQNQQTLKGHAKGVPKGEYNGHVNRSQTPSASASPSGLLQDPVGSCCAEANNASALAKPAILVFPVRAKKGQPKTWGLTQPCIDQLKLAFPTIDVLAECRKALVWVNANPSNVKTAGRMADFLFKWVARVSDRGGGRFPGKQESAGERRNALIHQHGNNLEFGTVTNL